MLKAMVPSPTAASRRIAWSPLAKLPQLARKLGACAGACTPRCGRRVSCFHKASRFSAMVATAEPWITSIKRPALKFSSIAPNTSALTMVPASSITYIRPTTRGCDSTGARSVASASPAVWVMCRPAPTSRKASPAPAWPIHDGHSLAWPPPDSTSSANGMIASPPNWIIVPFERKGRRRQPSAERWVSDLKPISARKGANSTGSEIITATSEAGTCSSTIITRFSVPTSSTSAMPTDTWNSDSRSKRLSGRSGEATSANCRKRGPAWAQLRISFLLRGFMVCPFGLASFQQAGHGHPGAGRVQGGRQAEAHALGLAGQLPHAAGTQFTQPVADALHQRFGRAGARGHADAARTDQPRGLDLVGVLHQPGRHALLLGHFAQPAGVAAVARPHHQHPVGLARQETHGGLPVLRGVADVGQRRAFDAGEAALQHRDDVAGVVHAQRGLGHVGQRRVAGQVELLGRRHGGHD